MVDSASMEAPLRRLRQQLDSYGVHDKDEPRTLDALVEPYDAALEKQRGTGIDLPGPPRSIGRRFTRRPESTWKRP